MNFGLLHADDHQKALWNYHYWFFMLDAWSMTPDTETLLGWKRG